MNANYKIKIDDQVIAYLEKKNKEIITLTVNKSGGGCCPTIEVCDVNIGAPENDSFYNKYPVGGVTVFVSKTARITAPVLKFSLKKTFFISSIVPTGLSLKGH